MSRLLIALIRLYQMAVAWAPSPCRYLPTCSAYAITALQIHGAARGTVLAAQRVLRCHPWHVGGYDPVPPPAAGNG